MKLCYLADGRSIHTKRWVEYFARNNEVHLITMDYPTGKLDIDVHETHYLPYGYTSVLNEMKVKRIVRDVEPDILHAHFATHYGYWGACTNFHPFVVSCWGDDVLIHPHKFFLRNLVHVALYGADLITCDGVNSALAVRDIIDTVDKINIIPHGVDLTRFKVHYNQSSKVVIYMRGFEPVYDWKTFFEVVTIVHKEVPSAVFYIIGGGSEVEIAKPLMDRLPVRYLGQVMYGQIPYYLGMSDVYVSTSKSEGGLALSMIEAMASGVVPVVTDVGDNSKTIVNGVNGSVCEVGNVDDISRSVIALLKDSKLRKTIGETNRKWVEKNQDYEVCMGMMDQLYRGLL